MQNRVVLSLVVGALIVSAPAFGDIVLTAPTGQWVGGWTANNAGEYWDKVSADNATGNCNIGFLLSGTTAPAACNNDAGASLPFTGPGVIPFLANNAAGSAPVTDFSFTPTAPSDVATLRIEIAGLNASNSFGYYSGGTLTELFAGGVSPIQSTTFSAPGPFGFYLKSGSNYYFTESSLGSVGGNANAETSAQHFALFVEAPPVSGSANGTDASVYWIGAEDKNFSAGTDGDFNDLVVRVAAVPEPTSVLLFGTLLAGAGVLTRRMRKS